ncbi:MAG: M48 family metalloprotease [Anaplasmataceae bacterium]|nr:M48 family metalloprotease [Anaplasmataceae bacterium]
MHAVSARNVQIEDNGTLLQTISSVARIPLNAICSIYDSVCPRNPLTEKRQFHIIPEWLEIAYGGYNYRHIIDDKGGEWNNTSYQKMTAKIFNKMIPHTGRAHLPWELKLVDTSTVNAWTTASGKMAIHRAFIERAVKETKTYGLGSIKIEDKLAAIIGHEASHVAARHTVEEFELSLLINVLLAPFLGILEEVELLSALLFFHPYSRLQEFEADRLGMKLMHKTGYDPKAAIWVQHFLKDYEATFGIRWMDWIDRCFWGHPGGEERVAACKIYLEELKKLPKGSQKNRAIPA